MHVTSVSNSASLPVPNSSTKSPKYRPVPEFLADPTRPSHSSCLGDLQAFAPASNLTSDPPRATSLGQAPVMPNTSLPFSSPSPPPSSALFASSPTPHSPTSPPSFAFPGPSSKFHSRERSTSQNHTPFKTAYTPQAPLLSTERRAHRKAQSHATPTTPALFTPPASDRDQSSPLSRFSGDTSATMADASLHINKYAPLTPASKGGATFSRPTSSYKLQDSPFSDYFTDDGRSTSAHDAAYTVPSPETQQLLVRLTKLQSRLMRGESGSYALNIVRRKTNDIEVELDAIHSQTRLPPDMEDSGLFMDEDDEGNSEGKDNTPNAHPSPSLDVAGSFVPTENRQSERDVLLIEAQEVLASVTKAHERLRQHHTELRDLNDSHIKQLEERDRRIEKLGDTHKRQLGEREQQITGLKSENETLQSDIASGNSELQFLRRQFRTLEAEVDGTRYESSSSPGSFEGNPLAINRKGSRSAHRATEMEEMKRWRAALEDVEGRQRTKRDSMLEPEEQEQNDWQTDTVQKGRARVQIISQRRYSSREERQPSGPHRAADVDEPGTTVSSGGGLGISQPVSSLPQKGADQSTQTESPSIPLSWLISDGEVDEQQHGGADLETHEADDCAITTASEDNDDIEEDDEDEEEEDLTPGKSAWQDLWDGLASLAGMGDDRW